MILGGHSCPPARASRDGRFCPAIAAERNDTMKPNFAGLNEFGKGYITAALWTFDENAPSGEYSTSGRPETLYDQMHDLTVGKMLTDCLRFQVEQAGHLRLSGMRDSEAGHCFWITRNRHGSGFWDSDIPETQREALTEAAHKFGECGLYTGDDGKIHIY